MFRDGVLLVPTKSNLSSPGQWIGLFSLLDVEANEDDQELEEMNEPRTQMK